MPDAQQRAIMVDDVMRSTGKQYAEAEAALDVCVCVLCVGEMVICVYMFARVSRQAEILACAVWL